MPDYTNVSTHPQPLASGRVLAPGESSPVSDDPHDRALIADGALSATETETLYATYRHDQLVALAEGAGLEVKPTGKDGSATNVDYVRALTAHDKNKEH